MFEAFRKKHPEEDHLTLRNGKTEETGPSFENGDKELATEQLRDFLYSKAIDPKTREEIKSILKPFEIKEASLEHLEELQNKIAQLNGEPDNIIPFPQVKE